MITFMGVAAFMVLLALSLVIVPLLRHRPPAAGGDESLTVLADGLRELDAELAAGTLSDAEHQNARQELQRQALQVQLRDDQAGQASLRANWGAALGTAIALPLLVALLYGVVGQPSAMNAPGVQARAPAPATEPHASDDRAIAALSERLAKNASDGEGWVLLARSYFQTRQLQPALEAYRKAVALMGDNADLLVEYANTLAISNDRTLAGEPERLVERALKLDPNNFNALAFAGLAAFQRDDRALALRHWRHLESLIPAGSDDDRARIQSLIARAQEGGETAPAPTAVRAAAAEVSATSGMPREIRGTVTVDAALAGRVAPSDTLFVFARAGDGPPMPLAAMRTRATGWPVTFTLDDSSAMAQGRALSQFDRVQIVARVSRLGSATAQPGDIEGTLERVAVGSRDVRVVMNRVVGR